MVAPVSSPAFGLFTLAAAALLVGSTDREPASPWHSPYAVVFAPDGSRVATTDRTGGALCLVDVGAGKLARRIALRGQPTGVAWSGDGRRVFVAEFGAGTVAVVDPDAGTVVGRFPVDRHPEGVALAEPRGLLLVANATTDNVVLLDLADGRERARIPVPREPQYIAVTPNGKLAVVANLLPAGRADDPAAAAAISLIDLENPRLVGDIRLPPGSSAVRHVAISRDGRRAYVVHILARNNVPSTQLERGWVNTNALTVIDLQDRSRYATVLLDNPVRGAADPWGVALDPDGRRLWIALSGVHQVARIDLERLESFLAGGLPDDHRLARQDKNNPGTESIWLRIKRDGKQRAALANDLAALTSADLIERFPVAGQGPRGLAMAPDGSRLAVASYFGGKVVFFDPATCKSQTAVAVGEQPAPDQARLGEMLFHDATKCFQHWLSCATCHPNDGRVDGLNWDQTQDGIGNPKNNKSLLFAQHTPPMTWRGVRADIDTSVSKGFLFLMRQPEPGEAEAVGAYLRSLRPLPSPHLDGDQKLTAAAERGRKLFHSRKTRCSRCHTGDYLTDLKMHDVGTRGELDRASEFDTPSLIELYRTAPYLHDGSAATLRDVLTGSNKDDKHGRTTGLTPQEIDDLIAYLRSL